MKTSYQISFSLAIPKTPVKVVELFDQSCDQILVSSKEFNELKSVAGYWKRMHEDARAREEILKQKVKELEAKVRDLNARLFGKKSEKKTPGKNEAQSQSSNPKKPRGQQPGSKGHGRTDRSNLPEKKEESNFSKPPVCSKCGEAYIPDESKEAEIIEVDVKAYKRKIIRQHMKQACSCEGVPGTITAPMPPVVLPKSQYGVSIWESVLLNKYLHSQPTNRLVNDYAGLGLPISPGTIAGGLRSLAKLFQPVYEALYNYQVTEENLFNNDESRWKIFEHVDGKIGNLWWLWVTRSPSVVFFQIAQSRGASVPIAHFEAMKERNIKVIIVCDRYKAYKSLAKLLTFIILAFCWSHVRRDFLNAAKKYPELEDWTLSWVEKIGELYHINNQRCEEFDQKIPIQWQSASFKEHHNLLVEKVDAMACQRDTFIDTYNPDDPDLDLLTKTKSKILTSMKNHWEGLTVFVDHPQVPMDNNKGEQAIRNPVTGRKTFYGSGSQWSAQMAAFIYSIFQTLLLWGINCRNWVRSYLNACAQNNGKPPEDLSPFLPWKMDEARRQLLSKPPYVDTS